MSNDKQDEMKEWRHSFEDAKSKNEFLLLTKYYKEYIYIYTYNFCFFMYFIFIWRRGEGMG